MGYEIKRLLPRHYRILDLVLLGWNQKDIAHELGITPYGLSNIIRSRVFQHELSRRRDAKYQMEDQSEAEIRLRAREKLGKTSLEAADTLVGLLESPNERIRQASAMDILDRSGIPKVSRQDQEKRVVQINISADQARRLLEATQQVFGEDMTLNGEPILDYFQESEKGIEIECSDCQKQDEG